MVHIIYMLFFPLTYMASTFLYCEKKPDQDFLGQVI